MSNKWNVDLKFISRDSYWLRDIPKPPGFTDLVCYYYYYYYYTIYIS
jgi:hypothetical protein